MVDLLENLNLKPDGKIVNFLILIFQFNFNACELTLESIEDDKINISSAISSSACNENFSNIIKDFYSIIQVISTYDKKLFNSCMRYERNPEMLFKIDKFKELKSEIAKLI
jgi:hypothetical protein